MPKVLHFLKRYAGFVIIAVVLVGGVAAAIAIGGSDTQKKAPAIASVSACGPYRKDGIISIDNHQFDVEIAYSAAAKAKGLGGRPCILPNEGMLFDFGKDGHYAIWMKDMNFPIDVIWIDSSHRIAAIDIDFKPSTYNKQHPEKSQKSVNQLPARYVLEVKANTAKDLRLGLGIPVHFQKA